ncbi:MAG: amidohydrolase family protein [Phycisphaerae bacterium]
MAAIDVHAHAFPDAIAKRAIRKLSSMGEWEAVGTGTVNGLVKSMDKADIDVSVICAIATKPGQAEGILDWCRTIRSDRIEPFPSVHPDTPDAADWVGRMAENDFAGVKLHPMYQEFAADEPRLDPIYAAAAEADLAVTLHCGLDIAFPPDDDRASVDRLVRVTEKHPKLKLVCTHLGAWKQWDQVAEKLVGRENVWLETSFSLQFLDAETARDIIHRHGVERVMLGSDWPWNDQETEIRQLQALELGEEAERKIFWSNAARLLGY